LVAGRIESAADCKLYFCLQAVQAVFDPGEQDG
jgi:hypothetical protein